MKKTTLHKILTYRVDSLFFLWRKAPKRQQLRKLKLQPVGFTIVELLIVIVVIGILAAITVVAYNGVQARANSVAVESDVKNAGNKIMQFYALEGRYPNITELGSLNLKFSKSSYPTTKANSLIYCLNSAAGSEPIFAIGGTSSTTGYYFTSDGGLKERAGWGMEGNAYLCPWLSVPTTAGYSQSWGHTTAGGWAWWTN